MFIHVCQCALMYLLVEYYITMEFMFSFNVSYTSYELPRHEKICFWGLRPGRRHKSGFTARRLEFGLKKRTSAFDFAVAQ